jgi:hypothetical protein
MLTLFNAIFRRFTADADVRDIVGRRVWEGVAQENRYPLVTVDVRENEDDAIDPKEAPHWTVTVTCETTAAHVRNTLAAAVKACLNRQEWEDENVAVVSVSLLDSNTSDTSDGNNAEAVYFEAELVFEFIAAV